MAKMMTLTGVYMQFSALVITGPQTFVEMTADANTAELARAIFEQSGEVYAIQHNDGHSTLTNKKNDLLRAGYVEQ